MQSERIMSIAGRVVGRDHRCFIIAEAGVNHNGSLERALAMVDAAADAQADAVKFQTFDADRLVTPDAPKAAYQIATTGSAESQHAMLERLQLSRADHAALQERCRVRGILFLSTPFDELCADMLAELDVPAFKLPSGELTNLHFLEHVARFKRPMIVSTGMATMEEVAAAVDVIRGAGNDEFALLQCVSTYPADPRDANLRAMTTMAQTFRVPVGYSDHTAGLAVSLAAAALGAAVIEKHFTMDRSLPGPDHRASLEPDELARLVREVRIVEAALGHGRKEPAKSEADSAAAGRKSLIAATDIAVGTEITDAHLTAKRPGTGISPARRADVIGRRAKMPIPAGTVLRVEMFAG